MSEWWQQPYKGGPMVAVPGFPRPLYPPDAKGRETSVDGDDVIAYKRTVWRAGRWPGPASGFDDTFSNAFSHGKSGNVGETGIAGVQRQQGIDPTGYVGEKTFNTLRSIRVPEGPHKGEMAMDANAANLIANAYYHHHAPPPPAQSTRERALQGAIKWLGYVEGYDNDTVFGRWYGMNLQPWCAMACSYWYEVEAGGSPSFAQGQRYSYVPYIVSDARAGRNGLSVPASPLPGDLVCYDWGYDGTYDHVGLFERWAGSSPSSYDAIEGNTSSDDTGSQSNGGGTYRRRRDTRNQATVFVRVDE